MDLPFVIPTVDATASVQPGQINECWSSKYVSLVLTLPQLGISIFIATGQRACQRVLAETN